MDLGDRRTISIVVGIVKKKEKKPNNATGQDAIIQVKRASKVFQRNK